MKQIPIDDKTYEDLSVIRRFTGRDYPEIVRELLIRGGEKGSFPQAGPALVTQAPPGRDGALAFFVGSPAYLANRSVVDQFLAVLSFVYKQQPTAFREVGGLGGRKRKYFAQSADTLENSGTSVNPKKIPDSPFWVVTNNSTDNKKVLLRQVLVLLGYHSEAIRKAVDSLR